MMKKLFLIPFVAVTFLAANAQSFLSESPDLNQVLNYALEHNFAIQQAKEQIEEQEGLIVEIKSSILPNASLVSSVSTKDEDLLLNPPQPGSGATEFWVISLEINQLIYSGGGIRATLEAQKYSREAVRYGLLATIDQVVFEVKARFYDALLAREQIKVEKQNVEYLQEQLENARNRYEAKTVSKFDVLRAEVELANAQPALIRARNNYRTAIDELYRVMGHRPEMDIDYSGDEIEGNLDYLPVDYQLENAIASALDQRPELLRLETVIKAYEAGVDVAKAGYFPNISLFGGYDYEKRPTSDQFSDSLRGWRVGIQGSWAIFDGRATRGRIIQARSQLRQAQLDKREFSLSVEVEVRRAISALQEAGELADAAAKVVEQAEEALRLAEARYEAGAATQLELLESRVSVTEAKTNQLSANYSYLIAAAQYYRAVGENRL